MSSGATTILKVNDKLFRKGLVIVQFTISVILIASTIIIYSQMQFIQQTDPGYNRSQVLVFSIPPSMASYKDRELCKNNKATVTLLKAAYKVYRSPTSLL